jgi:hypothetical protein
MTGEGMPRNAADCIEVAARFLAAQPGTVQRTRAVHRRGEDGCCTTCRPVRWPCVIAIIARVAAGGTAARGESGDESR